jgi:hypothetical protein
MLDLEYKELSVEGKVSNNSPCDFAVIGKYKGKLIFLCGIKKGINPPVDGSLPQENQFCVAMCSREGKYFTEIYIDSSKMKSCQDFEPRKYLTQERSS